MSEQRFSSKEQFAEEVRVEFEKRIGKSAIVQKINKNNGIVWYGLTVLEDKINISPTIYLEPYYEVCEDVGMEFIIDKIEKVYEDNKPNESMDLGKILDYESIKENLRAKLINYELNKDFLKEVPHRRFLDLAIVAFLELESNEMIEGQATITVKDNLQQAWGVDAGDIIDAALDNIKGDITLDSMGDYIDLSMFEADENWIDMYIVTNRLKLHGAVAMLQKDRLKEFADNLKVDTLTIIPSSIHECIIISDKDAQKDTEELRKMVREVNETVVSEYEILSKNVYMYCRATDEIKIA